MSLDDIPNVSEIVQIQQENLENSENDRKKKEQTYDIKGNAIVIAYKNYIMKAIFDALESFKTSNSIFCVQLKIGSHDKLLVHYVDSDGVECDDLITLHVPHYGGVADHSYIYRISNPKFASLFKEIQITMFKKGYYLLDLSDHIRGRAFVIKLYRGKPNGYDEMPILWHGYNKI